MRLIDADALQYSDAQDMLPMGQYITREEIDKAAEPVVQCKDCKYYEETDSRIGTCLLTISGAEVGGFCAWGEWRGDGDVV